MQVARTPPWLRMLGIVLGSISLLLASVILFVPGKEIETIILLLSVIFLVLGIDRIAIGVAAPSKNKVSRITSIVIGLAVIGLSIILMEFPVVSIAFLIILAAVALLIAGAAQIIHGIKGYENSVFKNYVSLGVGIICVIVSIFIIANPTTLGLMLLVLLLSISLIIVGISMVVRGIRPEGQFEEA